MNDEIIATCECEFETHTLIRKASGGIMLKDIIEIVLTAVVIIAAVAVCGYLEMGELEGVGKCATSIW